MGGGGDGNSTRDAELALPLQSDHWMTNEVCLFHPPPPFTLLLSVRLRKKSVGGRGGALDSNTITFLFSSRLPVLPSPAGRAR